MGDLLAPTHVLLILLVILLLFGPKKLPQLGNALGRTLRSFREGAKGILSEDEGEASINSPRASDAAEIRQIEQSGKCKD